MFRLLLFPSSILSMCCFYKYFKVTLLKFSLVFNKGQVYGVELGVTTCNENSSGKSVCLLTGCWDSPIGKSPRSYLSQKGLQIRQENTVCSRLACPIAHLAVQDASRTCVHVLLSDFWSMPVTFLPSLPLLESFCNSVNGSSACSGLTF